MGYLFDSTKALFKTSEPNGELRWNSVSNNIELVLTHPNGWGGPQQTQLRTAAVKAGIVSDTPAGHSRVHFVTEGEASFNFCATRTQAGKDLKPGEQVLIIDAGGGTIDISTYKVLNNGPLQVEELYEPKCLVQGAELVTIRATKKVQEMLSGSRFNTPDVLAAFSQRFDEGVKKVFSNNQAAQYVRFGSPRDNDPNYGIRAGKLMLAGTQVSGFFEPSIQSTVDSIRDNFRQRLTINSGTKVLEDREIRHKFCALSEGTPPQHAPSTIVKYTGSLVSPEWEDVEKGGVFNFPWYFVKSAQNQKKDKFQTLCYVRADLSTAPCTSSLAAGKMGYRRDYDVILLVGLTELKAQVSWIDSATGTERRGAAVVVYDNPAERVAGEVAY
ncbi:hypothetical protein BDM02DRAFT_3213948 [Thelephora ganbajun]|uniref:Uncharacterized protein n=1 Tax=Thelephora ganbajun TaxID=370292 RepID=A0ACB6ZMW6_THEGA|nr:hypothetical protein BDM02DRAFT_3213948 [Thelephora ganbajun]